MTLSEGDELLNLAVKSLTVRENIFLSFGICDNARLASTI